MNNANADLKERLGADTLIEIRPGVWLGHSYEKPHVPIPFYRRIASDLRGKELVVEHEYIVGISRERVARGLPQYSNDAAYQCWREIMWRAGWPNLGAIQ